jgi:hypothetical protein
MILDWHSHIYTPEEAADDLRTWDGNTGPSWGERGCPMVLENFVRAHKENNIDISVVTNAAHYLKGKRADEELPSVQAWSDYAAKVQQDHKGMLYSFATIGRKVEWMRANPLVCVEVDEIVSRQKWQTV